MDVPDGSPPDSVVFELGPLAAGAAPFLCDQLTALLLDRPEARWVWCDVSAIVRPAPSDLDHLARLRVAAARLDRTVRLRGVTPRLATLLALTGLAEVFGLGTTEGNGAEPGDRAPPRARQTSATPGVPAVPTSAEAPVIATPPSPARSLIGSPNSGNSRSTSR
jgi:anti-anti-sigma regulatory factor